MPRWDDEGYRALVSLSHDYLDARADLNRLLSFRTDEAESARWCNVGSLDNARYCRTRGVGAVCRDVVPGP